MVCGYTSLQKLSTEAAVIMQASEQQDYPDSRAVPSLNGNGKKNPPSVDDAERSCGASRSAAQIASLEDNGSISAVS